MKQGLVRLLYNFGKRFMGWTLHMIMCVLLCYPVSIRIYYQQGVLFLVINSNTTQVYPFLRSSKKWSFYCVNTSYPMDHCFSGRLFSPEQRAQLATPSYKLKKEKRDAKRVDNPTPTENIALVDPASVSVIGAVGGATSSQSPSVPPEKKTKKDKPPPVPSLRNLPLQVRMTDFQNWMQNGPNGLTGWKRC